MKSKYLMSAATLLLLGTWATGDGPEDLRRLAGSWSAIIVEAGGKEMTAEERGRLKMKLVVEGDNYRMFFHDEQVARGKLRIDPAAKPAQIDVIPSDGPHQGKVQAGIYAFQGDDLWTVFAEPGQPRPKGFKTRPGSMESMVYYRRGK